MNKIKNKKIILTKKKNLRIRYKYIVIVIIIIQIEGKWKPIKL